MREFADKRDVAPEPAWRVTMREAANIMELSQSAAPAERLTDDRVLNALRGLSKAVKQLADHFDKPITDENVPLWLALNSAQAHAEKVLTSPVSATARTCEWLKDVDGIYHTGCGRDISYDAPLADYKVKFCQGCGCEIRASDSRGENK